MIDADRPARLPWFSGADVLEMYHDANVLEILEGAETVDHRPQSARPRHHRMICAVSIARRVRSRRG